MKTFTYSGPTQTIHLREKQKEGEKPKDAKPLLLKAGQKVTLDPAHQVTERLMDAGYLKEEVGRQTPPPPNDERSKEGINSKEKE